MTIFGTFCAATGTASAANPLEVVGSDQNTAQTITLNRNPNGQLTGVLLVAVRNNTRATERVSAQYFPSGSERIARSDVLVSAGTSAPLVRARQTVEIALVATLPPRSSPSDLGGTVILRLKPDKRATSPVKKRVASKKAASSKAAATPASVELPVQGAGPGLQGVSIVPSSVTIHAISWWGPLSEPKNATATVQLRGPGLSTLFAHQLTVTTGVLLRSNTGHDVFAKLTASAPKPGRSVSNATVSVKGTLSPGSYESTLPLTDLTTGGAALDLKVHASHSFIWALLAVLLGAVAGGGIYLASNIKRRKDLLEASVRDVLDAYLTARASLARANAAIPLWKIGELGNQADWYTRKWSALLEADGVQGIWSRIYWARNNADLDTVETSVASLRDRVIRWLGFVREGDIQALVAAAELRPQDPPGKAWANTKTYEDTERLRRELQQTEPDDDAAARALRMRAVRQARWHAALALAWHMKSVVRKEVDERNDQEGRTALKAIKLAKIDQRSSPEHDRKPEAQLQMEIELDAWTAKLNELYRGSPEAIRLSGPLTAVILGGLSATEVRPTQTSAVSLPDVATPASEQPIEPKPSAASHAIVQDWFDANPGWLRALLLRDYGWSLVVVVVTTAAYVPIRYSSTWGSLGDYGTAFAAGFLGKAAINWGVLPLFASLSLKAKQPEAAQKKQQQQKQPPAGASTEKPAKSAGSLETAAGAARSALAAELSH